MTVAFKGVNLVVASRAAAPGSRSGSTASSTRRRAPRARCSATARHSRSPGKDSIEVRTGLVGRDVVHPERRRRSGALGKSGIPETWLFAPPDEPDDPAPVATPSRGRRRATRSCSRSSRRRRRSHAAREATRRRHRRVVHGRARRPRSSPRSRVRATTSSVAWSPTPTRSRRDLGVSRQASSRRMAPSAHRSRRRWPRARAAGSGSTSRSPSPGVAGPDGGSAAKPVGLTYVGGRRWRRRRRAPVRWDSDRAGNKRLSAAAALELLLERSSARPRDARRRPPSGRVSPRRVRPGPIRAGERIHVIGAGGRRRERGGAPGAAASGARRVTGCDAGGPSPYTVALEAVGIEVVAGARRRRTSRTTPPTRSARRDEGADRGRPRPSGAPRRARPRYPGRAVAAGHRRRRRRPAAGRRRGDARQEHDGGLAGPRPRRKPAGIPRRSSERCCRQR